MRELVKVVTVKDLIPIEGADRIVLATMNENGWRCIVSKDEFKPGDTGLYFEIDSVLPETDTRFAFLLRYKMRVKSIRMKGVLSQGLLIPLTKFPELVERHDFNLLASGAEGIDDLATVLGVKKYEPPEDNSTGTKFQAGSHKESNFPAFIPKTDQERIQNVPNMVFEILAQGNHFTVTEKLDGTSCTVYKHNGKIGVCSRNFDLIEEDTSTYWNVVKKQRIIEALALFDNIAFQGEIIGPGIQGNKYKLEEPTFYLFDIFNITNQKYLTPDEMFRLIGIIQDLLNIYIKRVPDKYYYICKGFCDITDVNGLLAFVERDCASSIINKDVMAEGIVIKSNERVNYSSKKLTFIDEVAHCKIINNNFLIRHGE